MSFGEKCHLLVFLNNASRQIAEFLDFNLFNEQSIDLNFENTNAHTIVASNPFDDCKPHMHQSYLQQQYLHSNFLYRQMNDCNNGFYRISATVFHISPPREEQYYRHQQPSSLFMAPVQAPITTTGQIQQTESNYHSIAQ